MSEARITRGHSCVPCQHRKIRCNGQSPCAHCIRTGKDCVRLRSPSHQIASTFINRGNQRRLIPSAGQNSGNCGQVVDSGDQRRYVEEQVAYRRYENESLIIYSNKLWTSLGDESFTLQQMGGRDVDSDSDRRSPRPSTEFPPADVNLIFGRQKPDTAPLLCPSAIQSFQLWQVFTSNVHPLTKLLHGPSVQKDILQWLSDPSSAEGPTEALIFSIYLVAMVSMTDGECQSLVGELRETCLARYCHATELALSRVDFLRSTDLKMLQAFTLYLLSLRHLCDHDMLWLLTGLATRMGQRMGLHREASLEGLPPFEAEIRRRVWWQIVILDGRAAQLTGVSMNPDMQLYGDTRQPLNLNDGDLVPSMSSLPCSLPVTTEMIFCSVRIEIGVWMIQQKCLLSSTTTHEKAKFLKTIDDLQGHIEQKYLRDIDTDVPLNLLTTYLARSAICQLRLSMYHPIHRPERASDLNEQQADMLLENSLEIIRYDILSHSTGSLQCYLWHIANFFPFETFVLLISTLSGRPTGQIVETAWDVVNQVYEHHPSFIMDTVDPLYWALGNFTLKAWSQRLASAKSDGLALPLEPTCITQLIRGRATLQKGPCREPTSQTSTGPATPQGDKPRADDWRENPLCDPNVSYQQPLHDGDANMIASEDFLGMMEGVDMDWGFWQDLLASNTHSSRDAREPFHFSSFMNQG
ncbi:hypothetical protein FZEAL_9674 [Fusarium zealandicum]|uniref:Zn(2)-C6 fungal-type domain-containing protein n=1 Tax=Fusarium zealandicum TaxID=1053134 RepID=A0A8H4U8Z7_9HYPO|nr:hypothetical protein FZEAL_9674 [Fusarium zealandicum]